MPTITPPRVRRPALRFIVAAALSAFATPLPGALAAEVGPPMFDITRQCDARARHNATAMSECVVAESEARADILQNWSKYADADAEKCIRLGRQAKRLPYAAMAKCLAAAPAAATPIPAAVHAPH